MIKKTIIAVALTTIFATTAGAAVVSTDTLQKPYQTTVTSTRKRSFACGIQNQESSETGLWHFPSNRCRIFDTGNEEPCLLQRCA